MFNFKGIKLERLGAIKRIGAIKRYEAAIFLTPNYEDKDIVKAVRIIADNVP